MTNMSQRISVVFAGLLIAGCARGHAPDPPTGYQIPANIHYSDQWVSTPAVDLMSADGTFIRAFFEAVDVQRNNSNGMKGSYPGFSKANETGRNDSDVGDDEDIYGYAGRWVLNFTINPDNTATAIVCEYMSVKTDTREANIGESDILTYRRVGAAPPTDQKGPARAPATSVFGDWYASGYEFLQSPDVKKNATGCLPPNQPPIDKGSVSMPGWPAGEGN